MLQFHLWRWRQGSEKGTFYFAACLGRARGRGDDSKRRRLATRRADRTSPNGVPRATVRFAPSRKSAACITATRGKPPDVISCLSPRPGLSLPKSPLATAARRLTILPRIRRRDHPPHRHSTPKSSPPATNSTACSFVPIFRTDGLFGRDKRNSAHQVAQADQNQSGPYVEQSDVRGSSAKPLIGRGPLAPRHHKGQRDPKSAEHYDRRACRRKSNSPNRHFRSCRALFAHAVILNKSSAAA